MSLIIYNKALSNFHEIGYAVSVQMTAYYNGIGKATIVLPINDYNISIIEKEAIVYDTVRDMAFVVENYKHDTTQNRTTVNCYTTNWLLNKRVIATPATIENVESGVLQTVSANLRDLQNIDISPAQGFAEQTETLLFGGQLLDEIIPILEAARIGHRMRWDADSRRHVFELYKGRDLTEGIHAVIFSQERGTAKNLVFSDDDSALKTVIYVPGELKDDTLLVEIVGDATGDERREKWMTGTSKQGDETIDEFRALLREKGLIELSKMISRQTFSVTIDSAEYQKIYSLGDIVSCVSTRFGLELASRITGVKYSLDINGEKINLILGEPVLTALDEVKING